MTKDDVAALGQSIGLDLSGAVRWLDANASNQLIHFRSNLS